MSAPSNVISLCAYRYSVRVRGTTLLWQQASFELSSEQAVSFAEAIHSANVDGVAAGVAGFRLVPKPREIVITGRGMGPMHVRRGAEATNIGMMLFTAVLARNVQGAS